jgi:hypothetical protein
MEGLGISDKVNEPADHCHKKTDCCFVNVNQKFENNSNVANAKYGNQEVMRECENTVFHQCQG